MRLRRDACGTIRRSDQFTVNKLSHGTIRPFNLERRPLPHPHDSLVSSSTEAGLVHLTTEDAFAALTAADPGLAALGALQDFAGQAGRLMLDIDSQGRRTAWFGLGRTTGGVQAVRALAGRLPHGDWAFAEPPPWPAGDAALAFALGGYVFDRFRSVRGKPRPRLVAGPDAPRLQKLADACALAKDMINSPASHMGPLQIETIARDIAQAHDAAISVITGEALIEANYPSIHAVGRAAAPDRGPRLIEMSWTSARAAPGAPLIALVGKGVTFDTGGLDLKPSSGMRQMKKDMGGAAHVLALAKMVMEADLAVRLAVLVPAVENAVSADAMRPGDILSTRKGLTVEVGNTDAEGRLILADALTRAEELSPDLTIDLATLTGAARVALGPEVIPYYTDDDQLAAEIAAASAAVEDPLWRMPLWNGYDEALESDIADLKNDSDAWAQAGSVTAALYLRRFAPKGSWVHFDLFAWRPRSQPGRPAGAEAQAIRALFHLLSQRYGGGQ